MMKKLLIIVSMGVLILSLTGCANKNKNASGVDAEKYVTLTQDQYMGIEATKEAVEVTDEEIQARIDSTLESNKVKTDVTDRAVQEGDIVNIDFMGTIDGEEFAGGTNEGYELEIGSNSFIDGFESGLIGHNAGETLTLNLTFPEDYSSTLYAGKDVVFDVTINSISTEILPEYTDEFVQSISEDYKTTAEYTEYLKGVLQDEEETAAQQNAENSVWNQIVSNAVVSEIPQELIDKYYNMMNDTYEQYAESAGMELEDFISAYYGLDYAAYEQNVKEQAESIAKESLVIGYIADKEDIAVTDEELQEQAALYAAQYGYESGDAFLEATDQEAFKENLSNQKVLDFVLDNAVIK